MKTLILYRSNCGHTKRYVDMLKTRISADEVLEFKHVSFNKIKKYDSIVYLAPIRNNVIIKLDKFMKHYKKMKDKNIFICAVGISCRSMDEDSKNILITTNDLDDKHVRLYFLAGGIDLKLMKPLKRFLFKKTLQFAQKKEDQPGMGVGIENLIRNGIDFVNPDYLDRLVLVYNRIKEREHTNAQ